MYVRSNVATMAMFKLWIGNVPPGMPAASVAGHLISVGIKPDELLVRPKTDEYSFAIAAFETDAAAAAALSMTGRQWPTGKDIIMKCPSKCYVYYQHRRRRCSIRNCKQINQSMRYASL